jgi:ubiquitin fusion degradation protein 1
MFLQGAADKLKREQDKRKADLQRRQAAERRAAAVAEAHRRERDDVEKQERHETRMREAEERAARERILANNEGISWETRLSGVRSDAAVAKGIRNRADDKVVLPPSAWRALQNAGAASSDRGHMFFEVSRRAGEASGTGADTTRRTHVAVLGFDGVEGTVGLPPAVLRQLGVSTADTTGRAGSRTAEDEKKEARDFEDEIASVVDVLVSYRRLPRGTYCKLQPKSQDFQGELASEAGVDLRALLETAMTRRCTLSVGDEVVVSAESLGGSVPGLKSYALRCVEVQPDDAGAVSLMETDVEVDIAPSEDYEAAMRRMAEAEAARLAAAAEAAAREANAARDAARAAAEALEKQKKQTEKEREASARAAAFRAAQHASLPPEPEPDPDPDVGDVYRARFALPDGTTRTRRFRASDPLAAAFGFVRALGGAGEREAFDLVTRFPRAVIREPSGEGVARETVGGCEAFVAAAASGGALFVERGA